MIHGTYETYDTHYMRSSRAQCTREDEERRTRNAPYTRHSTIYQHALVSTTESRTAVPPEAKKGKV
eukprot:scaffold3162_cov101-Isochrysis_galbana.AAC.2